MTTARSARTLGERGTARHEPAAGRRLLSLGLVALCALVAGKTLVWAVAGGPFWYGLVVFVLLSGKIILSWAARPHTARTPEDRERLAALRVGTAVPIYNEDPATLAACLRSILDQSRPVQSVVVVDDGSNDTRAADEAERWVPRFAAAGIPMTVLRREVNRGKREGLVDCLDAQPDADVLLCVDSDTVLARDALDEALKPYLDPEVNVVTGLVLALNHGRNLLTRLTDLRYANAFLLERAAYSRLGAVLCACGSLALYRTDVMRENREDFLGQTFLGQPAVFGDDRRQTNYGLRHGKAILQPTAVAETLVPESMSHYTKQQVRWSKSFFRESLWAIRHLSKRRPAAWLSAVELVGWLAMTTALIVALVLPFVPASPVGFRIYVFYALCVVIVSYARSLFYFEVPTRHRSPREKWVYFLLSPLYGALHVCLLIWLRVYALLTLRKAAWGTRRDVEVTLGHDNLSLAS